MVTADAPNDISQFARGGRFKACLTHNHTPWDLQSERLGVCAQHYLGAIERSEMKFNNYRKRVSRRIIRSLSPLLFPAHERAANNARYRRIYHLHLRKCAGTSINKAIISALGGQEDTYEMLAEVATHRIVLDEGPVVGWNRGLINKGAYFYGFSHEPMDHLKLSEDTYTFAFLRNPIDRIQSHFNMLNDMQVSNRSHQALAAEWHWAKDGFATFLEEVPRKHACNQLYMFDTNFDVSEALYKLKSLSFVGLSRDIEEVFIPRFENQFQLKVPYRPLRFSRHKVDINPTVLKKMKVVLDEEIVFFEKASKVIRNRLGSRMS